MNKIPEAIREQYQSLIGMSPAQIAAEWASAMADVLNGYRRMAAILRWKEENGIEIPDAGNPMIGRLRRIGEQLLPEVFERFLYVPHLLRRIEHLPIEDQRACISEKGVKVGLWRQDEWTFRLVRPEDMTMDELHQVFDTTKDNPHLRNVAEQQTWKPPIRRKRDEIQVNKDLQTVKIRGLTLTAGELAALLKRVRGR